MITKKISDKHKRVIPLPKKAQFDGRFIKIDKTWEIDFYCLNIICHDQSHSVRNMVDKWSGKFGFSTVNNANMNGKILLAIDSAMVNEAYCINIDTDKISITAGSIRAIDYAFQTLWQISPDGKIPTGIIEDKPSLKIRGFHINFDSYRQMTIDDAIYSIEKAAEMKLNTILLEYSNRFPFSNHKDIKVNTTLKKEDIKRINDKANELNMNIIPLQQTIGHLEYVLEHDRYIHFRENGESVSQICPMNTSCLDLVHELLDEIIGAHPGTKYIHLGGDEARSLGKCPLCKEKTEKYGISRLYIDYINSVCEYVFKKGLTPIIWDDMLCAHPVSLGLLDKRIVIMYWDYWTVSKSSPYFVARYDRNGKPLQIADMG